MTEPLRVVIFGAGMIGAIHRRASHLAGGHLVGVMDSSPEKSADVADRWDTAPVRDLDGLAALNPDVVHICTPNQLHSQHVEAAIGVGAHVICEKPLSVDSDQAQQLADLAAERVATIPFVYRFHPMVREIRARAQAGEFGTWQLLHGSYLQDWLISPTATSWRISSASGGPSRAFADIGSHWCDLMEFVTGERIASVTAATTITVPQRPNPSRTNPHPATISVDTEDAASVIFRTASGVLGAVTVSQVSAGRKNRLWFEFDGAKRSAVFDQEAPETAWLGSETNEEIIRRNPALGSAEQRRLSTLPAGHPQGYAQCFEAFVDDTYATIRGEHRDGLPTFTDGVRSAHVVDAVVESAKTGKQVDLTDH